MDLRWGLFLFYSAGRESGASNSLTFSYFFLNQQTVSPGGPLFVVVVVAE